MASLCRGLSTDQQAMRRLAAGDVLVLWADDEAILRDLPAWCEKQGCSGMDAMALPGHRSTKNFFEESGFTARKLVMHHRVGERRSR